MKWYKIFSSKEEAEEKIPVAGMVKVDAGGKMICLARTEKGFFAIDDECPHMSDSLSRGKINQQHQVICPWHNYAFSLIDGKEGNERCGAVECHEIRIDKNGLLLGVRK